MFSLRKQWDIYNKWPLKKFISQRSIRNEKNKKESLFVKILNRTLKLPYLKLLELSIGFVKGFAIKIEFFESKGQNE